MHPIRVGVKVGRNEKCPCASGKKFKQCCLPRPQPRQQLTIEERIREFEKRFDRHPGPADRIFLEASSQQDILDKVSAAMTAAGIDPAFIYAFQKTGLIVASENMDFLTGRDLMVWTAAVDEYRSEHSGVHNEE
jgi:hypothetical protein